jgi:hypothetical protein
VGLHPREEWLFVKENAPKAFALMKQAIDLIDTGGGKGYSADATVAIRKIREAMFWISTEASGEVSGGSSS